MITIKPHHFFDIIKLYGLGIEVFIPDTEYNHDFYAVANQIIKNRKSKICLVLGSDNICKPCKFRGKDLKCTDRISHIVGIESKNSWNYILDKRLLESLNLEENHIIKADDFCNSLLQNQSIVPLVWREETDQANASRLTAFVNGAKKYLNN